MNYSDESLEAEQMSNSKSEDTPKNCSICAMLEKMGNGPFCSKHYEKWLKLGLNSPEPPQDSPLGQVTSLDEILRKHRLYVQLEKDTERIERSDIAELKELLLAWHKAERAKLFEQIRSEVIGEDEYPDEHFPTYLGHKDDALAKKFDEVVTRDRLKTKQREALTRLEER